VGKATLGGRLPQLIRLQRSLPIIVGSKSFRHLPNLIQGFGAMKFQAFLIERAMVSLDKTILLGVMRVTDEHADFQRLFTLITNN
jgi:hypothetical protein